MPPPREKTLMIEEILPGGVFCAESFADAVYPPLFPQEESLIVGAAAKRRHEFAAGRQCARAALAGLGVAPGPILAGDHGRPAWPPGVVGAITHCAGYRAAAVAWAADMMAIGLDAEPADDDELPARLLDTIALPGERARLADLRTAAPEVRWDRLLFSAKESVFKAWFPLAGRWLGFHQADITIDAAGGFAVRLEVTGPVTAFAGRWLARDGLILTAIATPSPGRPPAS